MDEGSVVTRAELLSEFRHTWARHGGSVLAAAHLFGTKPDALARRLYRARAAGLDVAFTDDSKRAWTAEQRRRRRDRERRRYARLVAVVEIER